MPWRKSYTNRGVSAIALLQNHDQSQRPQEKDHPLVERDVSLQQVPQVEFQKVTNGVAESRYDLKNLTPEQIN